MKLSLMIKRKYLIEKVEEQIKTGVFHERRSYTPYWRSRIKSVHAWGNTDDQAVFLLGCVAYTADILKISLEDAPDDIKDVVSEKVCYNIECRFPDYELQWLRVALNI